MKRKRKMIGMGAKRITKKNFQDARNLPEDSVYAFDAEQALRFAISTFKYFPNQKPNESMSRLMLARMVVKLQDLLEYLYE